MATTEPEAEAEEFPPLGSQLCKLFKVKREENEMGGGGGGNNEALPRATTATSNGPSGNLSIKILLNYKDAQETNSNSQPKKESKGRVEVKTSYAGGDFTYSLVPVQLVLYSSYAAPCRPSPTLFNATRPLSVSFGAFLFPWQRNHSICQQVEC